MAWLIEWEPVAEKQFEKLYFPVQKKIHNYLKQVIFHDNPQSFGKGLTGDKIGCWRYGIGKYRVICRLKNHCFIVLIIAIGHRKEIL